MDNLKLLSKIALSFQDLYNFDQQMEVILEDIGKYLDISRIYIFMENDKDILSNTFEWCSKNTKPHIERLQEVDNKIKIAWMNKLKEDGFICEEDVLNLPQDILDSLKMQDIKSIVSYPLTIKKEIKGIIGFDEWRYSRRWTPQELEILNTVSGIISNAYERKIFRRDIIKSETNFRNFFETIDDTFIISDLEGRIIHSNKALIHKSEYSLEELKNMKVLELHPEGKREEASVLFENMVEGKSDCCLIDFQSKTGKLYLLEIRMWAGEWDNKNCIYSIAKDITKEKESIELFSTIFEKNPLPMIISDKREKKITKVNPAFLETTGYCEGELIGKSFGNFNYFIKSGKLQSLSLKIKDKEEIRDEESIVLHKNGKEINVILSVEEINSKGKESFLIVMVDITDRVELTKDVEDKCQKLTNIIEGTNLATWELDVQTGEIKFNEQWAKLIGYTLDELASNRDETWFRYVHPKDLKESNKLIEKHLNGDTENYELEVRMKHRDGRWIWVHDKGKVTERDKDGNAIKMFGTLSDITSRKRANEAIKENEKRFFLALDKTKAGLWDYDMISEEVFLSPMWKKIIGYEDYEVENSFESWKNLWHPDDKENILKAKKDYLDGKSKNYENVHRMRHKDGSWRWILSRGGVLRYDDGTPYRWIGTNTDITKEHQQSLELERIFSVNLDLLCILDMGGQFIKTNKAWFDILGYKSEELIGHKTVEYIHKDDIKSTMSTMKKLENNEKVDHFTNRYRSKDGEYRHLEWRANPHEGLIYGSARDVSKRIEYEKKILEISNRDALTNVYNRRYVFNRTKEIIEEYKRAGKIFSLSILDIDKFKAINDNYGHQAGDYILIEFTKIINKDLRKYDILGRYGGEEFIIILNNVDKEESNSIIKRILNIVRGKTFTFNKNNINFTFSAGIVHSSEIEKSEVTIDNLVETADRRMYEAKNTGRNKIIN